MLVGMVCSAGGKNGEKRRAKKTEKLRKWDQTDLVGVKMEVKDIKLASKRESKLPNGNVPNILS